MSAKYRHEIRLLYERLPYKNMEMLEFAIVTAIVVASTFLVSMQATDLIDSGKQHAEFEEGQRSFEKLENHIENLATESEGSSRLVSFSAGSGTLRSYDDTDTLEYGVSYNFGLDQVFTRNNITSSYNTNGTFLSRSYLGFLDIIGNQSRSGTFLISLKRNAANIEIEIV